MFGIDYESWILASKVIALLVFLFSGYTVITWTPLGWVAGFMWYDYLKHRFARRARPAKNEQDYERSCWRRYQYWVNVSLAWRHGLERCRQRSVSSWFRTVHATIYEQLSSSPPPAQVLACAQDFIGLDDGNLNRLARYISRELTDGGQADSNAVAIFLREEQGLADGESAKFLDHADRLNERFGIRPFVLQKWSKDERGGGAP